MKSSSATQLETTTNITAVARQNVISDNTAKIEFITQNGACLSGNVYDTATIKVTMGKYAPTKKFLNDVADTLAADMIDYLKNGDKETKITARLVYSETQGEQTA